MKTQELNAQELVNINGGGLFGGDGANQSGLFGSLGIDNLLTFATESKDGDQSSATGLSIGNGIGASLDKLTSSMFS